MHRLSFELFLARLSHGRVLMDVARRKFDGLEHPAGQPRGLNGFSRTWLEDNVSRETLSFD